MHFLKTPTLVQFSSAVMHLNLHSLSGFSRLPLLKLLTEGEVPQKFFLHAESFVAVLTPPASGGCGGLWQVEGAGLLPVSR